MTTDSKKRTPEGFRAVIASIQKILGKKQIQQSRALSYEIAAKIFGFSTSNAMIAFARENNLPIRRLEKLETLTLDNGGRVILRFGTPDGIEDTWIEAADDTERMVVSTNGVPFIATKLPLVRERMTTVITTTWQAANQIASQPDPDTIKSLIGLYEHITILSPQNQAYAHFCIRELTGNNNKTDSIPTYGNQILKDLTIAATQLANWKSEVSKILKSGLNPTRAREKAPSTPVQPLLGLTGGKLNDPGPRPDRKAICIRAIDLSMKDILSYLNEPGMSEENKKHVINDLRKAISGNEYDEVRMAEDLSRSGWQMDRELIDLCDSICMQIPEAEKELTEKWVNHGGITPLYQAGDKILGKQGPHVLDDTSGNEIISIMPKTAQYVIRTKEIFPRLSQNKNSSRDMVNLVVAAENITGKSHLSPKRIS